MHRSLAARDSRRPSPRATARLWMPAIAFQDRPSWRATAATVVSFNQSITSASNSAVNPEPGSAQGTATVTTP